jgi:trans-aconitate methyltransferase
MAVYFYGHKFYQDVSRYRAEVIGRSPVGDGWLEVYRSRRADAAQLFRQELEALAEAIALVRAEKVMQVGCGSGGELWALAQRFPGVDFVGVDINEYIIRQNAADLKETPNLRWLAGDVFATDHLERERPHLVFTSGSAEYFTEGELETFIQRAKRAGAKAVCFYESITQINFDYRTSAHSTTRGMMAFNHAYGKKLRAAGAQVVREELIASPDNPYVSNVLALGRL